MQKHKGNSGHTSVNGKNWRPYSSQEDKVAESGLIGAACSCLTTLWDKNSGLSFPELWQDWAPVDHWTEDHWLCARGHPLFGLLGLSVGATQNRSCIPYVCDPKVVPTPLLSLSLRLETSHQFQPRLRESDTPGGGLDLEVGLLGPGAKVATTHRNSQTQNMSPTGLTQLPCPQGRNMRVNVCHPLTHVQSSLYFLYTSFFLASVSIFVYIFGFVK